MDPREHTIQLTEDSKHLFFRFLNLDPDEQLVSLVLKNNVVTYTTKDIVADQPTPPEEKGIKVYRY